MTDKLLKQTRMNDDQSVSAYMEQLVASKPELKERLELAEPCINLAIALTILRRNAGLTQKQLAAKMGRDQSFVSKMESGSGPEPDRKSIADFAQACNAGIGYIFTQHVQNVGAAAEDNVFAVSLNNKVEIQKEFAEALVRHHISDKYAV